MIRRILVSFLLLAIFHSFTCLPMVTKPSDLFWLVRSHLGCLDHGLALNCSKTNLYFDSKSSSTCL